MKKIIGLLILFALALLVRTHRLNTPLADWHSWRQADTASVSWRFFKEGIDLFHPRYHDLSSIPSGLENPQGYRMVEFPLYNAFHALIFRLAPLFPHLTFAGWGRVLSIGISLLGALFFYLLLKKKTDQKVALLSLSFYLFLPFNIFYQRAILPENLLIMSIWGFLYFFNTYLVKNKTGSKLIAYLLSLFFLSLALLIKPMAVFFVLPALVFVWQKYQWRLFKQMHLWFLALLPAVLFLLWRWWIGHFPEGIPAFTWLLNGNGIRFKPAFFRWIFGDRIARLIMGYWGVFFLIMAFLNEKKAKYKPFLFFSILGALFYLFVFATGNVQHDYYQIVLMPVLSLMAGIGLSNFWRLSKENNLVLRTTLGLVLLGFTLAFSWFFVRDYYNINHPEIVEAGLAADSLLPAESKVIAPYMGDTAFLFQTRRNGWPIGGSIDQKINLGATHYLSVNFDDETNGLIQQCEVVEKTASFVIINLLSCQQ